MKKIFLMVLCCLVFTGCSDDDNTDSAFNENGTLLKQVIVKNGDEVFQRATFEYRSGKLYKQTIIAAQSGYYIYQYTGNMITKVDIYQQDRLYATEYYNYDSMDRLINYKYATHETDLVVRTDYIFEGPKITVTTYRGTAAEQSEVIFRKIAYIENGEVTKMENYRASDNVLQYTTTYVFDDKNSPYKMILGYNKCRRLEHETINTDRNIIAFRYSFPTTAQIDEDLIEIEYNSQGYPIKTTAVDPFDNNGNDMVREYLYQ